MDNLSLFDESEFHLSKLWPLKRIRDEGSTKRCSFCGDTKPLSAFHKNKRLKHGRANQCKACRSRVPVPSGNGAAAARLDELIDAQAGRCAVCGRRPERKLCLDHDHATGGLRGALCHRCNLVLGQVDDSPLLLRSMVAYLTRYGIS